MIKLSKLTDYAVVILAEMARDEGRLLTASGLSSKTGLPEPTVAKVLKLLTRGGQIESARGINGGYKLARLPGDISMASVITALEGPVMLTSCVDGSEDCCNHSINCALKGKWNPVNAAMQKALEEVTLAQMIADHEVRA
ncbi:MAG: SUF system Fe-S cluster assembly regulator [Micavibrio aeruginosavorus]|uniref:SUF system Fe-S cluster assembly regulator n=1 Tax=Micavibrio aeruginosavorus TaxID=349221 RepID=A0A2W5N0F1_9BACT|nr:MAG: SUF system Fe-S cluster assembly regulator [Micavibrio aeruginosavorus]